MKKVLAILIALVLMGGVAYANIGMEPLLNKCYDSTNERMKMIVPPGTSFRTGITVDSISGAQPLSSDSIACRMVIISLSGDETTEKVYIGGSTLTSANGYVLSGDNAQIVLDVDDISTVYFDADRVGAGVSWIAIIN